MFNPHAPNIYSTHATAMRPVGPVEEYGQLFALPNCNAQTVCDNWVGPVQNRADRGCGVNALRFLREITLPHAEHALRVSLAHGAQTQGAGALISDMVYLFNFKLNSMGIDNFIVRDITYYFNTSQDETVEANGDMLKNCFDLFLHQLDNNSCTIVKLNRSEAACPHLTPGHYIILSKENDQLWTYEPNQSINGICSRRLWSGIVSPNFLNAYRAECYTSMSIIVIERVVPMDVSTGGRPKESVLPVGYNKLMFINKGDKGIGRILGEVFNMFIKSYLKNMSCKKTKGRSYKGPTKSRRSKSRSTSSGIIKIN